MCQLRPTINLTKDTLQLLYDSGLKLVIWGVESGNDRILKIIRKGTNVSDLKVVLKDSFDVGIKNVLYIMFGFPTETEEDIHDTLKFISEISPNWVYANVLVPLPGTEVFRICVDDGLIDEKKAWSGELYENLQVNYTGTMSDNRFGELVDETFALCFKINRRPSNLVRRIPVRQYIANPLKMLSDSQKLISWMRRR